jgi:hypothetical protein
LAWALGVEGDLGPALALVNRLAQLDDRSRRRPFAIADEAARWLARTESAPLGVAFGVECLAWCGALPRLAAHLPEGAWWTLLKRLTAVAAEGAATAQEPLERQLIAGELPMALAYLFPELDTCQRLAAIGRDTITEGLRELLDGEGLPHCRHLPRLRPLLACWTRCHALGQKLTQGWCGEQAARQYALFVQHALRMSRPGGQPVFSSANAARWDDHLLKSAIRLAGDRPTERLARLTRQGRKSSRGADDLPSPAFESERAATAMLRPDWTPDAPRLTVAYAGREVVTEASVGPKCLWSGAWELEVRFNGQQLEPLGTWEQVCWISDDEVDYLELEMRLSQEVTVQRHMVLPRKERFLFLADAVLGIQQGKIEYRATLPLAGWSTFQAEAETREGSIVVGRRPLARVLPLALSEWRSGLSRGGLQHSEHGLELTQSAEGECMLAPLFIDLDARRIRKPATWRQLTVAQDRQIVPADVAVGYRVQAGKSQWLVYRSLAAPDIRTVLGKNLMHEFLVGVFPSDGKVMTLLEIE